MTFKILTIGIYRSFVGFNPSFCYSVVYRFCFQKAEKKRTRMNEYWKNMYHEIYRLKK